MTLHLQKPHMRDATIPLNSSLHLFTSMKMAPVFALFFYLFGVSSAQVLSNKIGINYGQLGNNLPSPFLSINLLQSIKASRVKLYDANPEIMKLLSGTHLQVSIMVPNSEIISISSNQTLADQWVEENVLAYYPQTRIRFLLVGNEILSYSSDEDKIIWQHLVPAIRRIRAALVAQDIHNIKVGTPLAMDILQDTFPPSNAIFRSDISESVIQPLLQFLNHTRSFFFIDIYPYFPWSQNPTSISLDFALFTSKTAYTDPNTGLVYTNLLDQMLDSLVFAMEKLGYWDTRISISETGWPTAGDIEEIGANIYNAATYNRNLIKKITAVPAIGTPARPGIIIPTFIFSLYDENQKTGPGTERHWGLFHSNGTPAYEIDITGTRDLSDYAPLPVGDNNEPFKGNVWCVVADGVDLNELSTALSFACNQGNGICDALVPGKECYAPVSLYWHASYAFSAYWTEFRSQGATCYFNGLAQETTIDPSRGNCTFPSVTIW